MYAAIANGGIIWQPTIAQAIVSTSGKVLKTIEPKNIGTIGVAPSTIKFLQEALLEVTISGTAAGSFAGFPVEIAGKTGTAQVFGKNKNGSPKADTSWFASFAPAKNPRFAVVMMVSQGGFGSSTSGAGVRKIYATLFGQNSGKYDPSKTLFKNNVPPSKLPKISPANKPIKEVKP
jgi:penicillin-binding protein 2